MNRKNVIFGEKISTTEKSLSCIDKFMLLINVATSFYTF